MSLVFKDRWSLNAGQNNSNSWEDLKVRFHYNYSPGGGGFYEHDLGLRATGNVINTMLKTGVKINFLN